MPLPNDWRRQGQESYLMNAPLVWSAYRRWSEEWNHDHCEFCGSRFSDAEGDLHEGYCTLDRYRWICSPCFNDFAEEFGWIVTDTP